MKPKPRSAFHIFKVPVAIALYFPLRHSPNSIRRPTNSEDRFAAARKIGCGCATRPAGLRQPRPRTRTGAATARRRGLAVGLDLCCKRGHPRTEHKRPAWWYAWQPAALQDLSSHDGSCGLSAAAAAERRSWPPRGRPVGLAGIKVSRARVSRNPPPRD
jgi:hypothetical protein